MQFTFPVSL